jgi:uncharacterized protein YbjT (DUF2867 family)
MNVLVIGAAGKTGRQVVDQAVAAATRVVAFIVTRQHSLHRPA